MADTNQTSLSLPGMARAGLLHSWRVSLSVAIGVATATAVIVGALLVGDSMRGSLRSLTVERLGEVRSAVLPGNFFDPSGLLAGGGESKSVPGSPDAVPLMFFPSGAVETRGGGEEGTFRRAGGVQIIGCEESFWELDVAGVRPQTLPNDSGVVLNASAAEELGVEVGDQVTVRLPVEGAVPADSPLGRREIQTEGLPRMEVLDVIPDKGLGRFSVTPNQASPQNVYVARATIADLLEREGQANAVLFRRDVSADDLQLQLADLGLNLQRVRREFAPEQGDPEVIYDYYSLTSDRLLLPEPVAERVLEALPQDAAAEVLTYLANAIERLDEEGNVVASVPYSTITATVPTDSLPLDFEVPPDAAVEAGTGQRDQPVPMVLNDWTAERLGAAVGDRLRVAYYEPEVENGREIERTFPAVVSDIVPVTEPATPYRRRREATFDRPPTVYNDPDLTPTVPGVTDQESISDWDLPFQLEREIEPEDDRYWNLYRLTPKAFLPLEDGRRLFGSRFGQTTSLKIDSSVGDSVDQVAAKIRSAVEPVLPEIGWAVIPIREQQLAASRGTTPFDGLFLALSFFVILAAVMLIAMLFRLGLVERLRQFGTLLAVGWTPKRVAALTLLEGLGVATAGVLVGLAGGIGYAMLVLWALRSWWVGAVKVPFLTFHWSVPSLLIGVAAGWVVSALAIGLTIRSLLKADAQSLLSGREDEQETIKVAGRLGEGPSVAARLLWWLPAVTAVGAVGLAAWGATASGQEAAAGFVGAGMILLIAALLAVYRLFRRPHRIESGSSSVSGYSLGALAARNAARHPARSTLSIGLMATAAFLIVAMAAFRLQPSDRGTGGFELMATSSQPLFRDLADPQVRADLLGPDAEVLRGCRIETLRRRAGQDASCNNLYQASQPTVLGVPAGFGGSADGGQGVRPDFEWADSAQVAEGETPWNLLEVAADGSEADPIPVVIDQNTAMWSLQMREGIGEVKAFEYEPGQPTYFRVVGLLSNSVLQGQLLIGEGNFETAFPHVSGYGFFLLDTGGRDLQPIASALERRLGDVGMDVSSTRDVLASLLAVQNTYLRTFQSLGGLGLLLGTVGLAVAQVRSVLERRRELAVMRAIGFTRRRLATTVMGETATLLLTGIGCGAGCAVLAVLPYAIVNGIRPPIVEPLLVVLGVILFGMLAGLLAVRRVLRLPLLASLRAE